MEHLLTVTRICILLRLPMNLNSFESFCIKTLLKITEEMLFCIPCLHCWYYFSDLYLSRWIKKKAPKNHVNPDGVFYLQTPRLLFNLSQKTVYTVPFSISLCKSQSRQSFVTWLSAMTTFLIQFPFINIYCCSILAFSQQNIVLQRDWKCHKRQRQHYEEQNISKFPGKILYCT